MKPVFVSLAAACLLGACSGGSKNVTEVVTVGNVSFEMALVEAGSFTMGATPEMQLDDENYYSSERPAHKVTLTNDFYIGKTEVTRGLWKAVMGSYAGYDQNVDADNKPMAFVSWNDCQKFITKINELTGKTFRLPTEAEWEFAARGGNKSGKFKFSGSNNIDEVGWYTNNSDDVAQDVATKKPNELGVYDMTGNLFEWCADAEYEYDGADQTDPLGESEVSDAYRVKRGGSCISPEWPVAARTNSSPDWSDSVLGLRLVLIK